VPNGENSKKNIMKQPKTKNLKLNKAQTNIIRSRAQGSKSIKITINIDSETLSALRAISDESGVPYQRMINRILKASVTAGDETKSRLDKLEKEVKSLKQKIAA
jgi:predicted DNA binding CopG/RHH family protein